MHGSFWVSAFRDSHITTALIISCVFMQKQEKLVSHLNNNEFVHNNNKSLFLAKKTTSVHIEGFVWIMQAFWLIIVNRYEFQLPWLQITKYIWWFKNPSLIWWFDNRWIIELLYMWIYSFDWNDILDVGRFYYPLSLRLFPEINRESACVGKRVFEKWITSPTFKHHQ